MSANPIFAYNYILESSACLWKVLQLKVSRIVLLEEIDVPCFVANGYKEMISCYLVGTNVAWILGFKRNLWFWF